MSSQKKKNDNRIWQRRQLPNEIIIKLIGNAHRAPSAIVRNPRVGKIPKGSSWPRIYRKSSSSICLENPVEEPERIRKYDLQKLVYYDKYGNTSSSL